MIAIKKWQETAAAHLPDLRETIDKIPFADVRASYMVAEIAELRAALAASGGNAAQLPGLPSPALEMTDLYSADQMTAYGKACAVASAPNAALVAASKQAFQYLSAVAKKTGSNEVWVRCESICSDLRAALSATGQEVGK